MRLSVHQVLNDVVSVAVLDVVVQNLLDGAVSVVIHDKVFSEELGNDFTWNVLTAKKSLNEAHSVASSGRLVQELLDEIGLFYLGKRG
jgi:hypothetical protein